MCVGNNKNWEQIESVENIVNVWTNGEVWRTISKYGWTYKGMEKRMTKSGIKW